jgi:hypothetical protein
MFDDRNEVVAEYQDALRRVDEATTRYHNEGTEDAFAALNEAKRLRDEAEAAQDSELHRRFDEVPTMADKKKEEKKEKNTVEYWKTAKGKAAALKYRNSVKGKAAAKRYASKHAKKPKEKSTKALVKEAKVIAKQG